MRESDVEKYLHDRIEALGGIYRRVTWMGRNDAPDDYISVPGIFQGFVECKRPGKKPTPAQAREHIRLRCAGTAVLEINCHEDVDLYFPLKENL